MNRIASTVALASVLASALSGGCTRKCKSATIRVALTAENLASADSFEVTIDGNAPVTGIPVDKIGDSATLEIALTDYTAKKTAMLSVRAMSGNVPLAGGTTMLALADGCTVASLALSATTVGAANAGQSSLTAAPSSGLIADGVQQATITVTVRDVAGVALPRQSVSLQVSGTQNTIVQPDETALDGTTAGTLATLTGETKVVSAFSNGTLLGSIPVAFVPALPVVTALSLTAGTDPRCMTVTYSVSQVGSQSADVALEILDRGRIQAITGSPFLQVSTSREGTEHSFVWDTSRQLLGMRTVAVTATPSILGMSGTTKSQSIAVSNAAQFTESFTDYPMANPGFAMVTGDFDGDHENDLAIANGITIDFWFGNGDGTFAQPPISVSAGTYPQILTVGDFDGDGKDDIATSSDGLYVIENITRAVSMSVPIPNHQGAVALSAGDFNGDGLSDLAAAGFDPGTDTGTIELLYADSDGNFTGANLGMTSRFVVSMTPARLNGNLGLVYSEKTYAMPDGSGDLNVLLNGGNDGNALPGFTLLDPMIPNYSIALASADLDGDQKQDLVLIDGNSTITIFFGNGNGTFLSQPSSYPTGEVDQGFAIADVNQDLKPDVLVAYEDMWPPNGTHVKFSVLLGNGDGTFEPGGIFSIGTDHSANYVGALSIVSVDLNHDGAPDVVVTDVAARQMGVAMNQQVPASCQ